MLVRAGPVLLISTITHGALLALVADWLTPPVKRPRRLIVEQRASVAQAATEPSAPIEVAFLVDGEEIAAKAPRTPRSELVRGSAATSRAHGQPQLSSSDQPSGLGDLGASAAHPSAGTSLFHMRGADLGLDPGTAQRIASTPHAPRDELRKSGKLESQPGGGAVINDRVTTVTVDPDGKAHFDDIPDIDLHFHLPIPKLWKVDEIRKDLGHELTEWFKDPEAGKRFGRTQDLPRHLQATEGGCDSWTDMMCDDPLAPAIVQRFRERKKKNGGGLFGNFLGGAADITAYLHRKYVGDPYASRKLKLLDDTREERVAMGERYRAQQAVRSAEFMTRNLDALWAREQRPVARRAALFELWDECGEDDAGKRARAVVIGWIRSHLPASSPDAYTTDEIAALQAHRASAAAFEPY